MSERKRVLVVGSGAREHALARAIARTADVIVAPGNAGIAAPLRRAEIASTASDDVIALAKRERIDFVVVGPEAPLCEGLADDLAAEGILTFGPSKAAARLEGSKAFMKEFATRHHIATASYDVVETFADAEAAILRRGAPVVVKASGLCAGKGVVVAATVEEAMAAARSMLEDRVFGDAGATVVIEACLRGEEASVHAISDGRRILVLPIARDHKRAYDGDRGPNTGGMGVIAPNERLSQRLQAEVVRTILQPTIDGMREEGSPFRGVLFAGLMITPEGDAMLLEHNVRFGDPECEALMALVDGDVTELLASSARGELVPEAVSIAPRRHACVVVLAARGYPAKPRTGDVIKGIDAANEVDSAIVLHAGTALRADGALVTAGGRVLAVTATGAEPEEARERAYMAAERVRFEGAHFRRDIGKPGRD